MNSELKWVLGWMILVIFLSLIVFIYIKSNNVKSKNNAERNVVKSEAEETKEEIKSKVKEEHQKLIDDLNSKILDEKVRKTIKEEFDSYMNGIYKSIDGNDEKLIEARNKNAENHNLEEGLARSGVISRPKKIDEYTIIIEKKFEEMKKKVVSKVVRDAIGELSEESKNLIKTKLIDLKKKFDEAKKHLDKIRTLDGDKTIGGLKVFPEIRPNIIGRGVLCNWESLFNYEALLIANEIHKIENTNVEFKYNGLESQIKIYGEQYKKFFQDIGQLKNAKDLKSAWNYGECADNPFLNIFSEFRDIGLGTFRDQQNNENFDLNKCQGVGYLIDAYKGKASPDHSVDFTGSLGGVSQSLGGGDK
jgi:hypothetical protein